VAVNAGHVVLVAFVLCVVVVGELLLTCLLVFIGSDCLFCVESLLGCV